ncbi:hypothetical protein [Desulfosarcina sp.]|uniref:hypothetical protein n=1 Tax=Desulfosarcina sp. TaxID=2027861 RepID=UPI003566AA51
MEIVSAESTNATIDNRFILKFNESLLSVHPYPAENLDCMTRLDGVSLTGIEPSIEMDAAFVPSPPYGRRTMSKSRDTKKDTKKKPAQTLKEKKKNKQEKKRP